MPPFRLTHGAFPEVPHRPRSFQRARASAIKKPSMESATGIGTMGATRLIRIPRRQLLFGNVRPAAGGSDLRGGVGAAQAWTEHQTRSEDTAFPARVDNGPTSFDNIGSDWDEETYF
jgi:hypothetical protein